MKRVDYAAKLCIGLGIGLFVISLIIHLLKPIIDLDDLSRSFLATAVLTTTLGIIIGLVNIYRHRQEPREINKNEFSHFCITLDKIVSTLNHIQMIEGGNNRVVLANLEKLSKDLPSEIKLTEVISNFNLFKNYLNILNEDLNKYCRPYNFNFFQPAKPAINDVVIPISTDEEYNDIRLGKQEIDSNQNDYDSEDESVSSRRVVRL